jgi:phosphopantothenoylcysteine synthetase/decarboxylase
MVRLHFIVTAGGTREPIDAVRYIGNFSTGRLGAFIADEALIRGHTVWFLHGPGSQIPRRSEGMHIESFTTVADLKAVLKEHVTRIKRPTVVVHAAAVADYLPEPCPGKISSDRDELVLRLKRAEKIVDSIKVWNPDLYLVKFKLESDCTHDELLQKGIAALKGSNADWVVANDTRALSEEGHAALMIRNDETFFTAKGKKVIAKRLVDEVERLLGTQVEGKKR